MPFSSEHRFKKKYDIHYGTKLNVPWVSEICGIPVTVLQPIFDEEYAVSKSTPKSMLSVYSYCIGGRVYKMKNTPTPITNGND